MKHFSKVLLASAALVGCLSLSACSSNSSSSNTNSSKVAKKKASPKYYKIGDTVKVGKVSYTLKSVQTTTERNQFEDSKPKNVIKVVYHVKNGTDDKLPIGSDLDVYGPTNNKLKSYPVDDSTLDAIAAGKESDVIEGFGTNKLGKFELQFNPIASFDTKPAKFKVTVK